jgi:hypothetical protein
MGIYPFMLGTSIDFEGIVDKMDAAGMKEPYDWDQYASFFIPKAEELEAKAVEAEKNGEKAKASEYYQHVPPPCKISLTNPDEAQSYTVTHACPQFAPPSNRSPGKNARKR